MPGEDNMYMWNESLIDGSTGQLFYCLNWAERHIQNLEDTKEFTTDILWKKQSKYILLYLLIAMTLRPPEEVGMAELDLLR